MAKKTVRPLASPSSRAPLRTQARGQSHAQAAPVAPGWTFLSNHAHVLLCLAQQADPTVREVAARVGVTERAVHKILGELEEGGYLSRQRDGRRNTYVVHGKLALRHPIESHHTIDDLIAAILK